MKKPELIAPAGEWGCLASAVEAGADAVYFGVKGLNMRQSADNFDILQIKKVTDFLHSNGKKAYLALNVLVYDNELERAKKILEEAASSGVDAVILWDAAVLSLARELGLTLHLSTQASVANIEALKFYSSLGAKRIVLARECTLEDISNMINKKKEEGIDCEIETFIHGSMCAGVSGRCFLSQDVFSRSANRGECYQPCRRKFTITDEEGECSYVVGEDYVLSARDLCTVDFIDELIEAGIDAFKIEGRMRKSEYVGVVVSSYREAVDSFFEGKLTADLKKKLHGKLSGVFNRGFTRGFYFGKSRDLGGKLRKDHEKIYLGEVVKFYKKIKVAEISLKTGPLYKGEKILIAGSRTPASFAEVTEMEVRHSSVEMARKGSSVGVKLPFEVRPKDKVFIWKNAG